MVEVACGRTQAVADVSYRLALCELAEQHRDQMGPAIMAFTVLVGLVLPYQFAEPLAVQPLNDLCEKSYFGHREKGVFWVQPKDNFGSKLFLFSF